MAADGAFARWVYSTGLRLAAPLYMGKLWWRGRDEPPYRSAWHERFATGGGDGRQGRIWVHAVSLGETRASEPLLQ
ncbi:glycosyltransferase N-terminal domain-containing protein, partial [Rubrivivax gelatinosus]